MSQITLSLKQIQARTHFLWNLLSFLVFVAKQMLIILHHLIKGDMFLLRLLISSPILIKSSQIGDKMSLLCLMLCLDSFFTEPELMMEVFKQFSWFIIRFLPKDLNFKQFTTLTPNVEMTLLTNDSLKTCKTFLLLSWNCPSCIPAQCHGNYWWVHREVWKYWLECHFCKVEVNWCEVL